MQLWLVRHAVAAGAAFFFKPGTQVGYYSHAREGQEHDLILAVRSRLPGAKLPGDRHASMSVFASDLSAAASERNHHRAPFNMPRYIIERSAPCLTRAELMAAGLSILGRDDVMEGVP